MRLMAELPDEAAALHFENTVRQRITAFGRIEHSDTKRYWKIPEWFEINISLQPGADPGSAYDGILSSLARGWERHDFPGEYQWAVWNPTPEGDFFLF